MNGDIETTKTDYKKMKETFLSLCRRNTRAIHDSKGIILSRKDVSFSLLEYCSVAICGGDKGMDQGITDSEGVVSGI